jgi:creatinine amidohydrolase/Fe(II)-dependent formamide hydrolase-like protein
MKKFRAVAAAAVLATLTLGCMPAEPQDADTAERQRELREMLAAPNPLAPSDSLWIEELTYMEVRDLIREGHTTAIIPTGGVEQNGPFLATGKHNVILRSLCPAIATELGNALCAPIVPFVPEGNIDPPSGAMHFPGSISVRDETFHALLDDIASSLKQNGFRDIVLLGDSGGNQSGMAAVAEELNRRWADSYARAHFLGEFYTPGWEVTMQYSEEKLGIRETKNDGHHDDIWVTAIMMVTDPASVRYTERVQADLASINGIDLTPLEKTVEIGKKMVYYRARYTADVIRTAITDGR